MFRKGIKVELYEKYATYKTHYLAKENDTTKSLKELK